jgi:hypothetical protein
MENNQQDINIRNDVNNYNKMFCSYYKKKLRTFCGFTSYVHLFQAIVIFDLWLSKKHILDNSLLNTSKSLMLWFSSNDTIIYSNDIVNQITCDLINNKDAMLNFKMAPIIIYNSNVEPMLIIFVFYLLSFIFQTIQSNIWPLFPKSTYNFNSKLRFIEYSISASLMLLTIGLQLGITDIFTLVNMFVNCFSCMIFGFFAEYLVELENKLNFNHYNLPLNLSTIAHICGWITLMISYYPIYDVFYSSIQCSNTGDKTIPEFVKIITIIQSILFCIFGFVQSTGLFLKKRIYKSTKSTKSTQSTQSIHSTHQTHPSVQIYSTDLTVHTYSTDLTVQTDSTVHTYTTDIVNSTNLVNSAYVDKINMISDFVYIFLSLVAKSTLGWIIIGNTYGTRIRN